MPKAKATALHALQLDPGLAEAYISLAMVQCFYEFDWVGAEQSFRRALELNPNYPTAYHVYAAFLSITGRPQDSILAAKRALEMDPLSIPINNFLGEMYMFAEDWERAAEQFRQTIEMDPNVWILHYNLGIVLEETGQPWEAVEEYLTASALTGANTETQNELRDASDRSGLPGFRQKQLELDLQRWDGWHFDTGKIAIHYSRLGEVDQALLWLEKAYEARSGWMSWIKQYPQFKSLYSHPRFQDLVRRVGLPE